MLGRSRRTRDLFTQKPRLLCGAAFNLYNVTALCMKRNVLHTERLGRAPPEETSEPGRSRTAWRTTVLSARHICGHDSTVRPRWSTRRPLHVQLGTDARAITLTQPHLMPAACRGSIAECSATCAPLTFSPRLAGSAGWRGIHPFVVRPR